MRLLGLILMSVAMNAAPASSPFSDLMLYNGTWHVSRAGSAKPDTLINNCAALGSYFACSQNVNGSQAALVVFVATAQAGHFHVQNIFPDGRASGITELAISGSLWTYSNRHDEGGKTTYYRTVNQFTGKNHIHFESATSSNNQDWKVDVSGDEERAGR